MTCVILASFISTCLPRVRQKHNKVCKYMLKDNPLTSRELNRATATKFSEFFFSKKCRVMPFLYGNTEEWVLLSLIFARACPLAPRSGERARVRGFLAQRNNGRRK